MEDGRRPRWHGASERLKSRRHGPSETHGTKRVTTERAEAPTQTTAAVSDNKRDGRLQIRVSDVPRLIALRRGDRNEKNPVTENEREMLMRRACARTPSPRSFLLLEHSLKPTPSPLCKTGQMAPAWRLALATK